jgi:hypothetical protein
MGSFLFQFVMGCRHRHQSRPFTLDKQTYKVCLDCGMVIHYSLEHMAPLGSREQRELKMAKADQPRTAGARHLRRQSLSGGLERAYFSPGPAAE